MREAHQNQPGTKLVWRERLARANPILLRGSDLLESEVNDVLEQLFCNGVIRGHTDGPLGACIGMELVFERLLSFDVTIDGDMLAGTSKAGLLPASKVAGTRVQAVR
jgi:hypothetical protein